jgi:hypothetical protein
MNRPGLETFPTTQPQQTKPLDRAATGIDSLDFSGDFFVKTVNEFLVCIELGVYYVP